MMRRSLSRRSLRRGLAGRALAVRPAGPTIGDWSARPVRGEGAWAYRLGLPLRYSSGIGEWLRWWLYRAALVLRGHILGDVLPNVETPTAWGHTITGTATITTDGSEVRFNGITADADRAHADIATVGGSGSFIVGHGRIPTRTGSSYAGLLTVLDGADISAANTPSGGFWGLSGNKVRDVDATVKTWLELMTNPAPGRARLYANHDRSPIADRLTDSLAGTSTDAFRIGDMMLTGQGDVIVSDVTAGDL